MPRLTLLLTALLCLVLSATCQSAPEPAPTAPPTLELQTADPTAAPTNTAIPPTATASATATPSPTSTPAPTATTDPSLTSPIFGVAWDDRTMFADGLISAERDILNQLPSAPVYHMDLTLSSDLLSIKGRPSGTLYEQ